MNIQGSTVLVTGANRGIGKSIVEAFVAAGAAKVYATARNPDSVRPLVEAHGDTIVPLALDLSSPDTITAAAQTATDVTIVVNNGGVLRAGDPLSPAVLDNIDFEFDVNVKGLVRVAQAFAPVLKANGGPDQPTALVQLNSVASLKNFAGFTSYSASKAAAYSLTQGLREALAEQHTLVVSVHPGPIQTDMATGAGFPEDMTEPPTIVADSVIDGITNDRFHVFPDKMARDFWGAYEGFAVAVVEPIMAEA
ncbi:MAG: SDR family oxidoreductase [Planctomycetota bacterium]